MSDSFTDNSQARRYELDVDGLLAFANYRRDGTVITLTHVEADMALRGTGAAGRLMAAIIETARAERSRIRPLCSYAVAWMRRHPEHADLLA